MELLDRAESHAELVVLTVAVRCEHIRHTQVRLGDVHLHFRSLRRTLVIVDIALDTVTTRVHKRITQVPVISCHQQISRLIHFPGIEQYRRSRVRIESHLKRSADGGRRTGVDHRCIGWTLQLITVITRREEGSQVHVHRFDIRLTYFCLHTRGVHTEMRTDLLVITDTYRRCGIECFRQRKVCL